MSSVTAPTLRAVTGHGPVDTLCSTIGEKDILEHAMHFDPVPVLHVEPEPRKRLSLLDSHATEHEAHIFHTFMPCRLQ